MIIVKRWITKKRNEQGWDGMYFKVKTQKWVGYFLFGIIPLWIVNESTEYTSI